MPRSGRILRDALNAGLPKAAGRKVLRNIFQPGGLLNRSAQKSPVLASDRRNTTWGNLGYLSMHHPDLVAELEKRGFRWSESNLSYYRAGTKGRIVSFTWNEIIELSHDDLIRRIAERTL